MMQFPAPITSPGDCGAQKARALRSVSYSEGATVEECNLDATYRSKIDRSNLYVPEVPGIH